MEESLKEKIINYLEAHNTLTLATEEGGQPWAAALYYVNYGFNLYFLSKPDSRHCQNLNKNPAVAVTVNEDYKNWREIKGIQLEGTAYVLDTMQKSWALALYVKKYPFVKDFMTISRFKEVLASVKFYKIIPSTIWFVDNSSGYFNRQEIVLE